MLTRVSENRAVIRPEARRKLFRAAHDGQLADFVEANKRLARYFIDRVEKTQDHADQFSWARAATYHLLAAGEPAGWEWLAHLYDDAEARGLISATQQLLQPLRELRFLLSLEDHAALTVYRARTATLTGNYRNAERLLRAVCALSKSQTLLAVTYRSLGQTLMAQQRWAQALQQLKKSRIILEHSGNAFSLALTWASIGDLYQEMADFSGGIEPPEPEPPYKPWAKRLRAIIYIPGRFYSQLSQRIQRLPFINVDLGYQNWVVTRLMLAAVAAYRRAEKALPDDPSPQALYDVRIGLARMYTKLGLIRRAERLLDELEKWDYVRESEYRQAFVFYWRAEVARFQGQNGTAVLLLKEAGQIFSKFQQLRGLAAIHKHLGTLAVQAGERQTALDELRRSADFYRQARQPLLQTAVLNQITELTGDESAAENGRHEYLSRFPNRLAGFYRLLAFLVLTLLLLMTIGLAVVALLFTLIALANVSLQVPGTFIFGLTWLT